LLLRRHAREDILLAFIWLFSHSLPTPCGKRDAPALCRLAGIAFSNRRTNTGTAREPAFLRGLAAGRSRNSGWREEPTRPVVAARLPGALDMPSSRTLAVGGRKTRRYFPYGAARAAHRPAKDRAIPLWDRAAVALRMNSIAQTRSGSLKAPHALCRCRAWRVPCLLHTFPSPPAAYRYLPATSLILPFLTIPRRRRTGAKARRDGKGTQLRLPPNVQQCIPPLPATSNSPRAPPSTSPSPRRRQENHRRRHSAGMRARCVAQTSPHLPFSCLQHLKLKPYFENASVAWRI